MDFLPVFMRLTGRPALVVGGGEVAARKAALLLDAGAIVTVVSPEVCVTFDEWIQEDRITVIQREFQSTDITDQALVIAATDKSCGYS